MVLPGHLAGGYLATTALLTLSHAEAILTPGQTITLTLIGTLAGDAPDIDIALYYLNQKFSARKRDGHRDFITHTPFFWACICAGIMLIGQTIDSSFIRYIGFVLLAGSWTHLILDSIENGVRWLYPLSNKSFYLRYVEDPIIQGTKGTIPYYWKFVTGAYLRRYTFYAEILITCAAIYVLVARM